MVAVESLNGLANCLRLFLFEGMMMVGESEWNEGFKHLRKYVAINKDGNVPVAYICDDKYKLGIWMLAQKRSGLRLGEKKVKLLRQQGVTLE